MTELSRYHLETAPLFARDCAYLCISPAAHCVNSCAIPALSLTQATRWKPVGASWAQRVIADAANTAQRIRWVILILVSFKGLGETDRYVGTAFPVAGPEVNHTPRVQCCGNYLGINQDSARVALQPRT